MRDPLEMLGSEKIYYISSIGGTEMLEFENMNLFKAGSVAKTYNLTHKIEGTGSVVYGRYLYFNRYLGLFAFRENFVYIHILAKIFF